MIPPWAMFLKRQEWLDIIIAVEGVATQKRNRTSEMMRQGTCYELNCISLKFIY